MDKDHVKLLLVEDDQGDAFLIRETLSTIKEFGFTMEHAPDLHSATALLVNETYDIILTDLGLPDSQGISTLETILDFATNTPVIVLTGLDDVERGIQAVRMGSQDYLVKGDMDPSHLVRSIRYAISRFRIEQELRASDLRMRTLFENGPDAYFITDLKGTIQDGNHVAEKLYGYRKKEFIGRNLLRLGIFSREQMDRLKTAFAHLSLGMADGPFEFLITNKINREIHAEIRFIPVEMKGETLVFVSAADVTEKKIAADLQKDYYNNMQLLSEASMEMIQMGSSGQVLNYISDKLLKVIGQNGSVIVTDIIGDSESYRIKTIKSNTKILGFLEKLLNRDVLNLKGRINPEIRDQIGLTRLVKVKQDLHWLSGGVLNKQAAKRIEEFIKLKEIYVMSLTRNNKIYGHLAFFTACTLENATKQLIETFINQASIILERISYQDALHESEERYRVLFESAPQGLAVIGSGDQVITYNKQILDILAVTEQEIPDIKIPSFYRNIQDRERLYEILNETGIVLNYEADLIRKNGESFIGNISIAPISHKGEACRLVMVGDITTNKRDEEERKKLYKAIEQSPSMVMITDAEGTIEYVNPSFCRITGYSPEESIGQNPSILKSGVTPDHVYMEMWKQVKSGDRWQGVLQNQTRDGKLFWSNLSVFPIFDEKNKLTHFVGIIVDITETKKAEEELIAAKSKAEESDRLKTAFLANISHEIRTPMNAILGFSNLLSSPDHNEEKKREFVDIIQSRSEDLMQIINNIVEISKIESGQVRTQISKVRVNPLAAKIHKLFEGKQKSEVAFNLDFPKNMEDLELATDPTHVTRILSLLVENAIKYTDLGEIILGYELKDNECIFYVKDTGIGIHPDKAEIIFNRFMQAETFDPEARGGNGLGLAIARDLTEILGGRIWLKSTVGEGSTFYLALSTTNEEQFTTEYLSGHTVIDSSDWSGKHILVAEDDTSNYLLIKYLLKSYDINLHHASNGMQAVELYKNNGTFDLILMDLKMPIMNGYEATRMIRSINKDIPIVALTASVNAESLTQCMDSGCNEYMSKPLNYEELLNVLNRYLEA